MGVFICGFCNVCVCVCVVVMVNGVLAFTLAYLCGLEVPGLSPVVVGEEGADDKD